MYRFLVVAVLLAFVATACGGPRYIDYFPYHDDGTPKPKVVILPIIDSSNSGLAWDVSQELYEGLYYEFMNSGEFYVPTPSEIGPAWTKRHDIDLFQNDISDAKEFHNTDFLVAMELVEHSIPPMMADHLQSKQLHKHHSQLYSLSFQVRVKVIDVRAESPKVVLYEIFKTCYPLMPSKNSFDCNQMTWNTPGYANTPCGLAHQRLIGNLAARLEEVIWSVK